jgi:uncharacterized protein
MKLLAFADLHGSMVLLERVVEQGKSCDLVVCAGDLTNFESNLPKLLQKLNRINKPVLIIPGNHEGEEYLKLECKKHKHLVFLHKALFKFQDVSFVGYGGGGFSKKDAKFEGFAERVSKHLTKKIVLITHGPPYGNKLDFIYEEHCGNKSYTQFIKKLKPVLAVSGHLHETAGREDRLGPTKLVNPGPMGKELLI